MTAANIDVVVRRDPSLNAFEIAVHHPPGRPPRPLLDALALAGWEAKADSGALTVRGKSVLMLSRGGRPAAEAWTEEQASAWLGQARAALKRFGYATLTLDG